MPPRAAVKFADESQDRLLILAVPFGGPFDGKDTDGEFFTAKTDLCLDWFPRERPLLYEHGLIPETGVEVIGRVDCSTLKLDDDGWWVEAELARHAKYRDQIKKLIERKALFASSGALPHLFQKNSKTGEILRWPWIELSLTPIPANLLASVEPVEAVKHFKAAGLAEPHVDMPGVKAGGGNLTALLDYWREQMGGGEGEEGDFDKCVEALSGKEGIDDPKALCAWLHKQATGESPGHAASEKMAGMSRKQFPTAPTPAQGMYGDPPEGSYEDLRMDLQRAVQMLFGANPFGSYGAEVAPYVYVLATFEGYCVVSVPDGMDTDYYEVEYTIGDDGEPVLGAYREVDLVYVPATGRDEGSAKRAFVTARFTARDGSQRTIQLPHNWPKYRVGVAPGQKVGRVLSKANEEKLRSALQSLADLLAQLEDKAEE